MKYSFNGFSNNADFALNLAISSAQEFGHSYIGSEHLLLGLCLAKDSHACTILLKNGVTAIGVELQLLKTVGRGNPVELTPEQFTPHAKKVVENALSSAACENRPATSDMLLYSLINESDNYAVKYIKKLGADSQIIKTELIRELQPQTDEDGCREHKKSVKRENKTLFLNKYAVDLTREAALNKLDGVIGREKEIKRVMQILCRRNKNNPCLVGEPGVGKTAVVEGLAVSIANGTAPLPLLGKKIMMLDLTSVVAGTKYRGDFEERIKNIVEEVKNNDEVLLFIDELHNLVGAGSAEGSTDAANILKPSLARGDFRLIGATTTEEYKKYIENDAALERRFQPVSIEEPSVDETVEILRGIVDKYQSHHNVIIEDEALVAAAKYADRYIQDRFLPDKAIDLVDETAARISLYSADDCLRKCAGTAKAENTHQKKFAYNIAAYGGTEKQPYSYYTENSISENKRLHTEMPRVTDDDIAASVSEITSIPIAKLSVSKAEKLNIIKTELSKRVVGQDEAVSAVSEVIRRAGSGFADMDKPLGSMIFTGPPGVGKTELCRCLAEIMFGSRKSLIKFDMSEFSEPHSISKLIGSPPGYVGYGSGGKLTEAVKKHPYSIVLFDEIEKADSEVCNLFLQILDEGKLTDSSGRAVNFRNTVVIMTSNIGSELLRTNTVATGFNSGKDNLGERKKAVVKKLGECYRQELLDRVDDIIVFNPLGAESMETITELMLNKLKAKVNLLGIDIGFSRDTVKKLARLSCADSKGARNIRRTIVKELEAPLSDEIINAEIKTGDKINVESAENGFKFLTA